MRWILCFVACATLDIGTVHAQLTADRFTRQGSTASLPRNKRVPRPQPTSLEYRLSWGIGAIRADRAYAAGATGAGVTVALIDTGLSSTAAQLLGHVSPYSTDLVKRPGNLPIGVHGATTAGLVAGSFDDQGTMGVAYQSTILAVRADIDGSCATQCAVRSGDLARGLDYAVAHGAKVIGVPLIGYHPLPLAEAALARAAASGAVIVAAAGNDAREAPAWPAYYASDPRFRGSIVVAGASTFTGRLADWSNRAGMQADYFVAAPGQNLLVDCNEKTCHLVSGTSFSVSYVAGALALLLDRNPALSPRQAASILLAGARNLGPYGTDPVYGRGLLDVERALRLSDRAVS